MSMPEFTAGHSLCRGRKYTSPSTVLETSSSEIRPQLRAGGGGSINDCVGTYQNCYVDCSVRYPDSPGNLNSLMRQGCFDSCDAAYRLCSPARVAGRIGRGIGHVAHVAAPIAG